MITINALSFSTMIFERSYVYDKAIINNLFDVNRKTGDHCGAFVDSNSVRVFLKWDKMSSEAPANTGG